MSAERTRTVTLHHPRAAGWTCWTRLATLGRLAPVARLTPLAGLAPLGRLAPLAGLAPLARLAFVGVLAALSLIPAPRSLAYMALLRQGVESAEVPNALDHYGDRVATGDFNRDGYDDLAVAAPDESNDLGGADHGVVIVSYGSARGITHLGADELSVGAPTDFSVHFGRGLAAGDFNGDGVDDLAVGIPGEDDLLTQDIGSVWIYAGIAGVGISLAPYRMLHESDVAGAGNEANDQFGATLAAGDVNLDGFDDLVASAIGEDNGAGAVFYFPGSAGGVTPTGSGWAKQSSLGSTNEAGSLFGYSLAIGDFYDTGYLDIAIGCPRRDLLSWPDAGQVYIVRGTSAGPVVAGSLLRNCQTLGLPPEAGSLFGWSLAAGHFFAPTGRADLAIGEPLRDVASAVSSGRVVCVDFVGNGQVPAAPVVLTQATNGDSPDPAAEFGWSLAAGSMVGTTGAAEDDGYDDLAVGAPGDAVIQPGATEVIEWAGVGSVYIFPCSLLGPGPWGSKQLDAFQLNDLWFGFDEHLGWSLAFGKFDDFGFDNLAIGCPNKDYPAFIDVETPKDEAGQVYIYAFWRQPSARPHRGSIVYDCGGQIMYAQRMKQRLTPASTTKALTALIACEAIQNGDIDPDQLYTVPAWVANEVTGSQYGLFAGEQMSFQDLIRSMIPVSGNDCAYAIGNILTGQDNNWDYGQSTEWNLEHILSDFADIMNARATQLGMSSAHHFNNPAGRPYGQHWTTAEDMAIFVNGAMENAMFRELVGTVTWNVTRYLPLNVLFPWLPNVPVVIPVPDSVGNGFLTAIQDAYAPAIGVKGGSNGPSLRTALFSGQLNFGRVTATEFGVPDYGPLWDLGADLMSLVDANCIPMAQFIPLDQPPHRFPPTHLPGVPTDEGTVQMGSAAIGDPNLGDMLIDVARARVGAATTCLALSATRSSECSLAPTQTRQFGVSSLDRHQGFHLENAGTTVARLQVVVNVPASTQLVTLQPGEGWDLPAYTRPASVPAAPYMLSVQNLATSGASVVLDVVEHGYGWDICLGNDRSTPAHWSALMKRDGSFDADDVSLAVVGKDTAGGSTVDVSLHEPGITTDAPAIEQPPSAASLGAARLLGNFPNPFNPKTSVAFEVNRPATVTLRVYDLAGRLVRTLDSAVSVEPGRHQVEWNGRDDAGQSVASGVYVVRLDDGAQPQAKTMVLAK